MLVWLLIESSVEMMLAEKMMWCVMMLLFSSICVPAESIFDEYDAPFRLMREGSDEEAVFLTDIGITDHYMKELSGASWVIDLTLGMAPEGVWLDGGDLTGLGAMTQLERLALCVKDLKGADLEFIQKLPNLECLEISALGIDEGLFLDDEAIGIIRGVPSIRFLKMAVKTLDEKHLFDLVSKNLLELEVHQNTGRLLPESLVKLCSRSCLTKITSNSSGWRHEIELNVDREEAGITGIRANLHETSRSFFSEIAQISGLKFLEIARAQVRFEDLEPLLNHLLIETLVIECGDLSDMELELLRAIPTMKRVHVTKVGGKAKKLGAFKALEDLRELQGSKECDLFDELDQITVGF